MRLRSLFVTERKKDARERSAPALRQIEIGCNVESRLALEDHFFDLVIIPLEHTDGARIERCSGGQFAAKRLQHPLANVSPPLSHFLRRRETRDLALTLGEQIESELMHVRSKHIPEVTEFSQAGGEIKLVGSLSSRRLSAEADQGCNDRQNENQVLRHSCSLGTSFQRKGARAQRQPFAPLRLCVKFTFAKNDPPRPP